MSTARTASSETARSINRQAVWELIRHNEPHSRAGLARISGLQPSTVSAIVEQLLAEGWVCESEAQKLPRGRRPKLVCVNKNMVCLAVDLRPHQFTVGTIDLMGELLGRKALPIHSDPRKNLEGISGHVEQMRQLHKEIVYQGVGVAVPGRVDEATQRLVFAPNFRWQSFNIKKYLEGSLEMRVEMDNAANACLLSELFWGARKGVNNAVVVAISEGIGTGILVNGKLVRGEGGMAGEFGHISLDPSGLKCSCHLRGCWEVYGSTRAALRYYSEEAGGEELTAPGEEPGGMDYSKLLQLAQEGDALALRALERQARYIGRGLAMISAALSPELILLAGDFTQAWGKVGRVVEEEYLALKIGGTRPAKIEAMEGGDLARLRGAAAMVFERRSAGEESGFAAVKE